MFYRSAQLSTPSVFITACFTQLVELTHSKISRTNCEAPNMGRLKFWNYLARNLNGVGGGRERDILNIKPRES